MAKIRYSDEFICPKCGSHTALVCRTDGTHQAHCMICDVYYDVEVAKATNADQIRAMTDRAMTDEELAEYLIADIEAEAVRRAGRYLTSGEINRRHCRLPFMAQKHGGGAEMSERQEKKKRYNLRLMWIADFDKWLNREPPMWKFWAWRRWKRERPVWVEVDNG